MEPEFDVPMTSDDSRVPNQPTAAGVDVGSWGYGVEVYGAARGHHRKEMPSLIADMFGFSCEEEMTNTKQYFRAHGDYQIEQVSDKQLVMLYYFMSKY